MGKKHGYGVVLDAGSSGSRVYVYEYKKASYVRGENDVEELARLPKVKTSKDATYKVHPGIATFGAAPERVGEDHLQELLKFALDHVPSSEVENTPIFLLATAGMRLLPAVQRSALLEASCAYLREASNFLLPDCNAHVQVISGEVEGLYGWIAANYLLGGFDKPEEHNHGKGHHTYGFLDMGGASAQIAFAPNATEAERHANDLKLLRLRTVAGEPRDYRVFVTTWLGFGANEARRRYVDHLFTTYPDQFELPDPCLPKGIMVDRLGAEITNYSSSKHLIGTGDFAECLRNTYPLLEKDRPCSDPPCLLNGVHTPAIDFDVNHFVGVSEYWHTTHEIFAMAHKDTAYDLRAYQAQVTALCSRPWSDIQLDVAEQKWGKKVDELAAEQACFKASWLINMLHDGIGVPRASQTGHPPTLNASAAAEFDEDAKDRGFLDPFQAVDKIGGIELSWTLGKMLLYASSQMPPADVQSLPVGFGTNVPGSSVLPTDFQQPGGNALADQIPGATVAVNDDDWREPIFRSHYSRRVPGIFIFLVILGVAMFFVCGRERRKAVQSKLQSYLSLRSRRRRGGPGSMLTSKLLGREPGYERVLESGSGLGLSSHGGGREAEWELGSNASSRSSDADDSGMRSGLASGISSPAVRSISPDLSRYAQANSFHSEAGHASMLSQQMPSVPSFSQLHRTQSRERFVAARLTVVPPGSSRPTSPRRSSPMRSSPLIPTPFKENVD